MIAKIVGPECLPVPLPNLDAVYGEHIVSSNNLDKLMTARHESLQFTTVPGDDRKRSWFHQAPEQGNRPGINGIGLGKLTLGPCQITNLAWIDNSHSNPCFLQGQNHRHLIAARCFGDDRRWQ